MAESTISCPKCGGRMVNRLGEYECIACGLRLTAVAPEEQAQAAPPQPKLAGQRSAERFKNTGDGLTRDANSYGGGWTPSASAPPPPPPGRGEYNLGGLPPPTMYGDEPSHTGSASLTIEKNIYYGIHLVSAILILLFIGPVVGFMTGGAGLPFAYGFGAFTIGVTVVVVAVIMALLAFVLYGDQVWAKWGCGVITIVVILFWIFSIISLASDSWFGYIMFASGTSPARLFISLIPNLFLVGWLLSMLWRDIKEQQGG